MVVPGRVAAILRGAALSGLGVEEARRLERHLAFQADLSLVRGLIAGDPEAALRALADPGRYRGLTGEDRAALAGMAARGAEVARLRRGARAAPGDAVTGPRPLGAPAGEEPRAIR